MCSGGLRLKRDITEYGEFVRSFNAPSIDEKFELLGMYVKYLSLLISE
jgi:exocyst complex component 5